MTELSLLWPDGVPTPTASLPRETVRDLELEAIVQAMCPQRSYQEAIRAVVLRPCLDSETIAYRQLVMQDLQAHPQLVNKLQEVLPLLDELPQYSVRPAGKGTALRAVLARTRELELLVETVRQLDAAFATVSSPLSSPALSALREKIATLVEGSQFQALVKELPALLEVLRGNASITIGVNLDHQLRPEAAILLSVNEERFTSSSILDRLLGKGAGEGKGIAPLHQPIVVGDSRILNSAGERQRAEPLMAPLFRDLAKVLEKAAEPIARELKKYAQVNGQFLALLRAEIIFYVQAHDLVQQLQAAGLSLTYPEIAPAEERVCRAKSAYNLQLAIQAQSEQSHVTAAQIVANDVALGEQGRIAILTGPNRGGKTTYMQAIGQLVVLAQIGMPVPGEAAQLSPVDAIYTHYPVEERLELGTGRFGDEAQRIRVIFEQATRYSLVLLNESLSTTSTGEGYYIARDVVRAMRQVGLRAVFTTHLHELAAAAAEINAETTGDSDAFSLVASKPAEAMAPDQRYSHRVEPGPPLGRSYAEHIASQYGISSEQLQALLEERDLLAENR